MKTFFYFVTPPLTLAKTVPKSYQTDNWGLFFFIWEGVKNTLRGESPNLAAEGHKTLTPLATVVKSLSTSFVCS